MGKPGAETSATKALAQFSTELAGETRGDRKLYLKQLHEALKTGGVGARIPIIQRAVESSKQATSSALTDASSNLASAGLGRTPYAQQILSSIRTSGGQVESQIPTDIAQQFISQAPAAASGFTSSAISGLSAASSASQNAAAAAQSSQGAEIGGGAAAAGTIAAAAIIAI